MERTARYILTRVAVGLLIGAGMFYFRSAHAESITVTHAAGNPESPGLSCVQGLIGSTFASPAALGSAVMSCTPAGSNSFVGESGRTYCAYVTYGLQAYGLTGSETVGHMGDSPGNGCHISYGGVNTKYAILPPASCTVHLAGKAAWTDIADAADSYCASNCVMDQTAQMGATTFYESTGAYCQPPQSAPTPTLYAPPPSIQTPAGTFNHEDRSGTPGQRKNCGTINGQYKCLAVPTGTGKCTRLTNGAGYCASQTPGKPPVAGIPTTPDQNPNNGTPGTNGPGGMTIFNTHANTTTTIYPASTFNNSTNYTTITPPPPGDGGTCTGTACGTGEGGGSNGAFTGKGGTVRTFGESTAIVSQAFTNGPLATKVRAMAIPSGGSCPSPTIHMPYLKTSIVMDAHCIVAQGIRAPLRAVFLAIWLIIAVGVFLRP